MQNNLHSASFIDPDAASDTHFKSKLCTDSLPIRYIFHYLFLNMDQ